MKIYSYSILHYGADYAGYALRSVYEQIDQLYVFYTPHPSHGHQPDIPPIESREQLREAVFAYDPDEKIRWYDMENAYTEGPQRDTAVDICRRDGADMILVVDCDEVWHYDTLKYALNQARVDNCARHWLINFTHLWRSFNWCCRDEGWPVRIIDLRHNDGVGYINKQIGEIYHFGYAVRDEIMRYKWQIHGHKGELRDGWLDNQWRDWPPVADCHPTNDQNFWMPEPFNKALLPSLMRLHPFNDLEKIE